MCLVHGRHAGVAEVGRIKCRGTAEQDASEADEPYCCFDLRAGLLAMLAADAFSLEDIELQAGFILTADDWNRAGLDPDTVPATYPWEA